MLIPRTKHILYIYIQFVQSYSFLPMWNIIDGYWQKMQVFAPPKCNLLKIVDA